MEVTKKQNDRISKMTFASVYPHYLNKVKKKGRSQAELHQVISWLTGYDESSLEKIIQSKTNFEDFFQSATLHPNVELITGMICGYRIEDIGFPLVRKVRYLDKLVDELARGRKIEKILRQRG